MFPIEQTCLKIYIGMTAIARGEVMQKMPRIENEAWTKGWINQKIDKNHTKNT